MMGREWERRVSIGGREMHCVFQEGVASIEKKGGKRQKRKVCEKHAAKRREARKRAWSDEAEAAGKTERFNDSKLDCEMTTSHPNPNVQPRVSK
jgi:hypothetical protein